MTVSSSGVIHIVSDNARRGAQVFAVQLVEVLQAETGCPADRLIALERSTAAGKQLSLDVVGRRARSPVALMALTSQIRSARGVVAHGSTTLQACALASLGARTPWVYRNIGDPTAWGQARLAQLRIGWPLRRASAVVALYEGSRQFMIERYRLDLDWVVTIPNAVPTFDEPDDETRESARSALDLQQGLRWLAFVGALSDEKRVLDAIQAVSTDPDLGLVVAGDGPQRREAEDLAVRTAPGRVKFLGVTDRPLTVIAAVEAVIIPSRTEGIPGVAIEAGLSGVPVVATRVGGVPELVLDGKTGVLVDSVEPHELLYAIHTALDNSRAMGRAARAHCEANYTMERIAPQWAELLQRVIDDRG